jgi:hypothetical protein
MMLHRQLSLLFAIATFLLTACSSRLVEPVFYFWHDQWELPAAGQQYFDTLGTEHLYVRFFDVEWDEQRQRAIPIRSLRIPHPPRGLQIVPVVYISEKVIGSIGEENNLRLAQLIHERILRIADALPLSRVQVDCNWDAETEDTYFRLLESLQAEFGPQGPKLSVCLYPHHILPQNGLGIPPAASGMLMLFEIDKLQVISAGNTICDPDLLRPSVLAVEGYPLPLDLALPIFNWGLVIRNQQPVSLMRHLHLSHLEDRQRFEVVNAYFYRVLEDTYLDGVFLFKNDLIRVESLNPDQLRDIIKPLAPYLRKDSLQLGFYHFDLNSMSEYPVKEVKRLIELFE